MFAQQGQVGTAQEAMAMLDKAVAAVKADKSLALAMFDKGLGGFYDRDLYPFCSEPGTGMASPLRLLFRLARIQNSSKTPPARRLASAPLIL